MTWVYVVVGVAVACLVIIAAAGYLCEFLDRNDE